MSTSETNALDAIESLPWVQYVGETGRPDASHKIETDLAVVRRDHEIEDIEAWGVQHVATSTIAPSARLYVRFENSSSDECSQNDDSATRESSSSEVQ